MNATQSSLSTRLKVGGFTLLGLVLAVGYTVFVNNRPFWWRPCQYVKISVPDATGLKTKAPIRSLGIEIGYLKSVMLTESHVTLGICLTAPVEVLSNTHLLSSNRFIIQGRTLRFVTRWILRLGR
ncbi:MAG: MCE family protein [Candidatus Melainabacteria bacterium]|nr:MCE family protein [Candidatus Melainabacteria bacterium]